MARDALTVLRENMLARVSESPDVRSAIREQSEGIAVTAVGELRERSARADNLAERTVRPPLRRWPNPTNTMTAAVGATGQRAGFVTRLVAVIADMIILSAALRGTVSLLMQAEHALRRFAPPFSLGKRLSSAPR